jgi:hypothetical protein
MKDTSPEMEARFREMMMARTPVERLKMATGMFMTAKALIRAGLEREGIPLTPENLREYTFLRLYRRDFTPEQRVKIVKHLREKAGGFRASDPLAIENK